MPIPNKPVVLVILDGWGIAPASPANPISVAKLPTFEWLVKTFPTMAIQASGEAVGLPWGEMGNSEVGHLNLGAGKIVYQNLPRISKAISDGIFFTNPAFLKAAEHARRHKSTMHLLGMIGPGGVHSSTDHLYALMEFCEQKKLKNVMLHLILDGRDAPRDSALVYVKKIQEKIKKTKVGLIASLSGRFYAMDRDNRWERVEKAYRAIVEGTSEQYATDPVKAIEQAYRRKVYDEEFVPTVIGSADKPVGVMKENDAVIFFNFRPDRARQLTKALVLPGFEKFKRPYLRDLFLVTMTEYDKDLPVEVAFPPETIQCPLARIVSEAGLKQLHIAETEKYAHVTYFFNGGHEELYSGQNNIIIPSPSVATYDQRPEMSAVELTERLLKEIERNVYDFIVVNYANADMVGHTGDVEATVKAAETIDQCLDKLIKTILASNGVAFITADHGNAEELANLQTGAMDKEHSVNPVPLIAVRKDWEGHALTPDLITGTDLSMLQPTGILSDITVTVLTYLGLTPPPEMTGHNVLM